VRNLIFVAVVLAAVASANVAAAPAMATPAGDACALLTPEQVGEAVSAKMSAGTYPSPGFTKTCTWVTTGIIVTLMLEGVDAFQSGKARAFPGVEVTLVSGVGDDAYYVTAGKIVSLFVKKSSSAFKATIYSSSMPMDKRKAIEKELAQKVVSKI
jgi:hypothetical protein